MLSGFWQEPVIFEALENDLSPASLETRLRELLTPIVLDSSRDGHQAENLAVFARWYYSSWRDGDWVAWTAPGQAGYRKLARAVIKLAKTGAHRHAALSC
jgi:hypothetical protein